MTNFDDIDSDELLPPWEKCIQCTNINEINDEIIYSGSSDNHQLECDNKRCKVWVHPTCDGITHENLINLDTWYCKKCRTKNKKLKIVYNKYNRKLTTVDENTPKIDEVPSIQGDKKPDQPGLPKTSKQAENNHKSSPDESEITYLTTAAEIHNTNLSDSILITPAQRSQKNLHPESEQRKDKLNQIEILNSYEDQSLLITPGQRTPNDPTMRETITESQVAPESIDLDKSSDDELNVTVDEFNKIIEEEMDQINQPPINQSNLQGTLKLAERVKTPKIRKTRKKKSDNDRFVEVAKNHPLQHRNKQEVILECIKLQALNFETTEKFNNYKIEQKSQIDELNEELTELKEYREKYQQIIKSLDATANLDNPKLEDEITRLKIQIIDSESTTKEYKKKLEEAKKGNISKQNEIKKLKDTVKNNLDRIHAIESSRDTTQGHLLKTEELLKLKSEQLSSLEKILKDKVNMDELVELCEAAENSNQIESIHSVITERNFLRKELSNIAKSFLNKIETSKTQPDNPKKTDDEINDLPTSQIPMPVICVYYKMGKCTNKNCKFNHEDEPTVPPTETPTNQKCVFFRMGQCKIENCRFNHQEDNNSIAKITNKINDYSKSLDRNLNRDSSKSKRNDQNPDNSKAKINKSEIPCIFDQRGRCKWGRKCYYKHDKTPYQQQPKTTMRTEDIPCRYFAKGFCIWENECIYKHATNQQKPSLNKNKQEICIRYTKGRCNLGNFCKYKHLDQGSDNRTNTSSVPDNKQAERCKKFDEGYCPNRSCQFTHRKDRTETPTSATNKNPNNRCKDFDNGFCPRKAACTMPHKKDRTQQNRISKSD